MGARPDLEVLSIYGEVLIISKHAPHRRLLGHTERRESRIKGQPPPRERSSALGYRIPCFAFFFHLRKPVHIRERKAYSRGE